MATTPKTVELEYNWPPIKIKGSVTKRAVGSFESHTLRVKAKKIAEYRKRLGDPTDEGETISYLAGRKEKIGTGNLLAGVLLRLGYEAAIRRQRAQHAIQNKAAKLR